MIACAHCGRRTGAYVRLGDWPLCYPDDPGRPACWRRVQLGEAIGALKGIRPLPPGVTGIKVRERVSR